MKVWLHHVNIVSHDVPELTRFYRDVLGLGTQETDLPGRRPGYPAPVDFLGDGQVQFHLAGRDLNLAFRAGQSINPVDRGHLAFRTDDLDAFRRMLEERGIPYSNYGDLAAGGWRQIFFQDPVGTVIEVHEIAGTESTDVATEVAR